MINSILFVGIGGSGRSTLHWVYDMIRRDLTRQGYPWFERAELGSPMPRCWGFAAIDTEFDVNEDDPVVPASAIRRIEVANAADDMPQLHGLATRSNAGLSRMGWFPPVTSMPVINPAAGMGQFRALGRVVSIGRLPQITKALDDAVADVTSVEAGEDASAVAAVLKQDVNINDKSHARVVLVSSIAGGTGSGMWLDVAQYFTGHAATAVDGWLRRGLMSVLYLPEVYERLQEPDVGIAPNSMFGIGELLSAYADRSVPDAIEQDLDRLLGAHPHPGEPDAPATCLFVGARGEGLTFTRPRDVYASTARTLTGLLLDSSRDSGFKRVAVNASNRTRLPLLGAAQVPASSLGFASLDLGYETFGDYVARRLFRTATHQLLEPDGPPQLDRESRANASAAKLADLFFEECGLHEKNAHEGKDGKRNQILEGVEDATARSTRLESFMGDVRALVNQLSQVKRLTATEAEREIRNLAGDADEEAVRRLLENAIAYGDEVRERTIEAVIDHSATESVPVVLRLLELLDDQLEAADRELGEEREAYDGSLASLVSSFAKDLDEKAARRLFENRARVGVRDIAIPFIRYVREGLVQPLRRDLRDWLTEADLALTSVPELQRDVSDWDGKSLPTDLEPPPTVALLTPLSDVDERYEQVISGSQGKEAVDPAQRACCRELVAGFWPGIPPDQPSAKTESHQDFVRQPQPFSLKSLLADAPGDADADRAAARAAWTRFTGEKAVIDKARFEFPSLLELTTRSALWAQTRSHVSDHVATGLRAWLDKDHPEHAARKLAFLNELKATISRAAPLSIYAGESLSQIHGKDTRPRQSISLSPPFPFAKKSALGAEVLQRVGEADLPADTLAFATNTPDTGRLDFVRSYPDGVHPLATTSLTDPIVDEFSDPDPAFWLNRRSRPFSQALGLTPAQLIAMARGWLAAVALGQVDKAVGAVYFGDRPVQIPDDALRLKRQGPPDTASGWLTTAMESFLPRLMLYTQQGEKVLDWYVQLAHYGGYDNSSATVYDEEHFVSINGVDAPATHDRAVVLPVLENWIVSGTVPNHRTLSPTLVPSGEDAHARREALQGWLRRYYEIRAEWAHEARNNQDEYLNKPLIAEQELFPHFMAAAAQLTAGLAQEAAGSGSGSSADLGAE